MTKPENSTFRRSKDGSRTTDMVRVCGSVIGQIEAKRVELTRAARVTGDILHEVLTIETGAYFEGNCQRIDKQDLGDSRTDDVVVNITNSAPNTLSSKKVAQPRFKGSRGFGLY